MSGLRSFVYLSLDKGECLTMTFWETTQVFQALDKQYKAELAFPDPMLPLCVGGAYGRRRYIALTTEQAHYVYYELRGLLDDAFEPVDSGLVCSGTCETPTMSEADDEHSNHSKS